MNVFLNIFDETGGIFSQWTKNKNKFAVNFRLSCSFKNLPNIIFFSALPMQTIIFLAVTLLIVFMNISTATYFVTAL